MSRHSPGHQGKGGQTANPALRGLQGDSLQSDAAQARWGAGSMGPADGGLCHSLGKSLLVDRQHLICCVAWADFLPPLSLSFPICDMGLW